MMSSDKDLSVVSNIVATLDTPDIPTQLANISYRLDILITIALTALVIALAVGVCYMFYRFLYRCI